MHLYIYIYIYTRVLLSISIDRCRLVALIVQFKLSKCFLALLELSSICWKCHTFCWNCRALLSQVDVKLALARRFGGLLAIKLALERRFTTELAVKLALERHFWTPIFTGFWVPRDLRRDRSGLDFRTDLEVRATPREERLVASP